jgi:hypothetical protein
MPTENSTQSDGDAAPAPRSPETVTQSNSESNAETSSDSPQRGNPANTAPTAPESPQRSANPGTPNFGEVLTAIQAIPEQVARAVRELAPRPSEPRNPSANQTTQGTGNGAQTAAQTSSRPTTQTPGKKSFADWWFGR